MRTRFILAAVLGLVGVVVVVSASPSVFVFVSITELAAVAAFVAAFAAIYQSSLLKRAIHLQATVELMRQYTVDFWTDRNTVDFDLAKRIPELLRNNPKMGFDELPEKDRDAARRISFFFDLLGLLVKKGYVSKDTFISFLGGSAIIHYRILRPFIENERKKRPRFQKYFEDFVAKSVKALSKGEPESHGFDKLGEDESKKIETYWSTGKWN